MHRGKAEAATTETLVLKERHWPDHSVLGRRELDSPPPPGGGTHMRAHRPRMHWKGRDLKGGPRSGWLVGGWKRLPKRLGAVNVGEKCR